MSVTRSERPQRFRRSTENRWSSLTELRRAARDGARVFHAHRRMAAAGVQRRRAPEALEDGAGAEAMAPGAVDCEWRRGRAREVVRECLGTAPAHGRHPQVLCSDRSGTARPTAAAAEARVADCRVSARDGELRADARSFVPGALHADGVGGPFAPRAASPRDVADVGGQDEAAAGATRGPAVSPAGWPPPSAARASQDSSPGAAAGRGSGTARREVPARGARATAADLPPRGAGAKRRGRRGIASRHRAHERTREGADCERVPAAADVSQSRSGQAPAKVSEAVPRVVRDLLAAVSTGRSPLAKFLRSWRSRGAGSSQRKKQAKDPPDASAGAEGVGRVFPAFAPRWQGKPPASARRRQRIARGALARAWAEVIFGVGSWHALGRPWTCPASLPATDGSLRSVAWSRCVERSAGLLRSASSCDVAGGGRRSQSLLREARDQEAVLVDVALEHNAYDRGVPTAVRAAAAGRGPKRIEAAKLSLPARGCTWDIAPHLSGKTRAGFENPAELLKPPAGAVGRARVHGSGKEELAMYRRFDDAEMLYLARPCEVPVGRGCAPVSSGFFVVPKSEDADRTVQDRRAANGIERRIKDACTRLPHGTCFTELQLLPGETLRVHADDLPDCFHSVRCTDARAVSNAIGEPRQLRDFAGTLAAARYRERCPDADEGDYVYACNRALPMGDGNAVEFVQAAHVALLREHGAARAEELASYREPAPRGDVWETVMVDDHAVIARVPAGAERTEHDRDSELLAEADAAYAADNLVPKASKRVRDAQDAQVLGAAILGTQQWVSAAIPALVNTLAFSEWVLRNGVATAALWEGLTGLWVNVLLYNRTGFALTRRLYVDARDAPEGLLFRPSLRALDEVRSLAALAPLLGTDIGAPVEPEITAVDASSHTAAVVSTWVGETAARELWRHRARRGNSGARGSLEHVSLPDAKLRALEESADPAEREIAETVAELTGDLDHDDDDDDNGEPGPAPTWVAELADGVGWQVDVQYRCPRGEHINLKEARPLRTVVRAGLARCLDGPRRHITLSDSSVNVGAWGVRGRSPSPRLNGFLVDVACDRLALGFYLGVTKVETEHNPADNPTRHKAVREIPRRRAPAWLAALQRGDYRLFDEALANDKAARRLRALPLGQLLDERGARQWRRIRRTADLAGLERFVGQIRRALGVDLAGSTAHAADGP